MIIDSKGREVRARLGRKERIAWALKKQAEEFNAVIKDKEKLDREAKLYRDAVLRQRESAGLPVEAE